ncbi:MAG TPA: hypothetical protein VNT99_09510 [Methylomirabilota bacterium]|nr:hypothetical protein [Methylomirabilota bacterium]
MPDDPNKAEELLKRHAKERRERGADFSLHPATRRLLQGEVKRQFPAPRAAPGWLARFGLWRSRFAAVAALVAVIFAGVWFFARISKSPAEQQFAQATSPRVERELFLARAERLAEATKEPAAPRLNELAKTEVETRGLAERLDGQSKLMRAPAAGGALAPAQQPPSPLDNVALFSDAITEVAATNAFNYSLALAPVQTAQGVQGPPAAATQFGNAGVQSAGPSLNAAQNMTVQNTPAIPQLGTAGVDASLAANARFTLSDEAKLAKQSNLPLEQRADEAGRAQISPPTVALAVTPLPQSVAAPTDRYAATAPVEEKLNRGELADLASASQIRPGAAPQRFYRSRAAGPESQVAQRITTDSAAGKKAESSDLSGAVLSEFTVEQDGNRMRWRDADGSLYEGAVGTSASAARGFQTDFGTTAERDKDALTREKALAQKEKNENGTQDLFFSVAGSNVTTRQVVTVNGRFAPDTNRAAGGGILARRLATPPPPAPQRAGAAGLSQDPVMIEGTVRVGGSSEQRFQAVRAPR